MDIQADLKWIHQELDTVNDPLLIQVFKNLLTYRRNINTSSATSISIEQYNKEIDQAEKDIESGNSYTTSEAKKIANQWGRK